MDLLDIEKVIKKDPPEIEGKEQHEFVKKQVIRPSSLGDMPFCFADSPFIYTN